MEDDILTDADLIGDLPIQKVGLVECNLSPDGPEGLLGAALQIIDHGDAGARCDEWGRQIGPDEAGAAGHEDRFSRPKRHRRIQALAAGEATRNGFVIIRSKTSPIRAMSNSRSA